MIKSFLFTRFSDDETHLKHTRLSLDILSLQYSFSEPELSGPCMTACGLKKIGE